MENRIELKGTIRNIQPSHTVNNIEYNKAELVVSRKDGNEDVLNLKFKRFSNPYEEDQQAELIGNIRSYSRQIDETKNKVEVYVFTYFDRPENELESCNSFVVEGRICKINELRTTQNGKHNIHFILANNICTDNMSRKLNNYLPCVVWGKTARECENLAVNDKVRIKGELHSRSYKKTFENGEIEFRVAHELVVTEIEVLNEELI